MLILRRGSAPAGDGKLLVCHVHMLCVLSHQFGVARLKIMFMNTTPCQSSRKPMKSL